MLAENGLAICPDVIPPYQMTVYEGDTGISLVAETLHQSTALKCVAQVTRLCHLTCMSEESRVKPE